MTLAHKLRRAGRGGPVTYVGDDGDGSVADQTGTTLTITGLSSAGPQTVVFVGTRNTNGRNSAITGVTMGGTSLTELVDTGHVDVGSECDVGIYWYNGSLSGDIVITVDTNGSSELNGGATVTSWSGINGTIVDTATTQSNATSSFQTVTGLTAPSASGARFFVALDKSDGVAIAWAGTASPTEISDFSTPTADEAFQLTTAYLLSDAAGTITSNFTNLQTGVSVE